MKNAMEPCMIRAQRNTMTKEIRLAGYTVKMALPLTKVVWLSPVPRSPSGRTHTRTPGHAHARKRGR